MPATKTAHKPVACYPKLRDVVDRIDELAALLRQKAADPDLCHLDTEAIKGLAWVCWSANETLRAGAGVNDPG